MVVVGLCVGVVKSWISWMACHSCVVNVWWGGYRTYVAHYKYQQDRPKTNIDLAKDMTLSHSSSALIVMWSQAATKILWGTWVLCDHFSWTWHLASVHPIFGSTRTHLQEGTITLFHSHAHWAHFRFTNNPMVTFDQGDVSHIYANTKY
jgi:hypothetical protein